MNINNVGFDGRMVVNETASSTPPIASRRRDGFWSFQPADISPLDLFENGFVLSQTLTRTKKATRRRKHLSVNERRLLHKPGNDGKKTTDSISLDDIIP